MMKFRNRISNLRFSATCRDNLARWSSAMDYLDSKPMARNIADWMHPKFPIRLLCGRTLQQYSSRLGATGSWNEGACPKAVSQCEHRVCHQSKDWDKFWQSCDATKIPAAIPEHRQLTTHRPLGLSGLAPWPLLVL